MSNVKTSLTENAATVTPFAPTVDIPASDVQTAIEHVMANAAANELFGVTMPVISATISADQNDYAPTGLSGASILRITVNGADRTITGLVPGSNGQVLYIQNVGPYALTLYGNSGSSLAANRFPWTGQTMIGRDGAVSLQYSAADGGWIPFGVPAGWGNIDIPGSGLFAATAPSQLLTFNSSASITPSWDGSSAISWELSGAFVTTSKLSSFRAPIGLGPPYNAAVTATVAASALTVTLVDELSSSTPPEPIMVGLRSSTANSGVPSIKRITTTSPAITISSGSTLGTSNSVPFALWLVMFDDGVGADRLGLINCLSGTDIYPLGAYPIASSTAEGGAGAADSAHVFYTGTAVTSKAYTIIARLSWESGLATAGTWSAGPTRIELVSSNTTLPGKAVQGKRGTSSTYSSTATTIPFDDTIPQNTEGAEVLTKAITPQSAANILRIAAQVHGTISATDNMAAAIFQDSTANALAAEWQAMPAAFPGSLQLSHAMIAGTTAQTTFKLRAGSRGSGSATLYINGGTASRFFGGVAPSWLEIEEIAA